SLEEEKTIQRVSFDFDVIHFFNIKIVDSEISAKTFGLKNIKHSMVGNVYSKADFFIDKGESVKLGETILYLAVTHPTDPEKKIKFCLCDVKFQLPDFRGWNFPKDRTIYKGDTVRILKQYNGIEDDRVWKV